MMVDEARAYFEAFRQVVGAVNATLAVQEVLKLMVEEVTRVMHVKACAIRLLNPKTRTLEIVASKGLSESYLKKGPVDADRSIAEAMDGSIVVIDDAGTDPRAQYGEEARREGIVGICSVPMKTKGRIIGVLRLYSGTPRHYTEFDLEFVEGLAEVGAMAIENARMYERLKQDYESVMSDIYRFVGYRRSI